jgi:hypothetical protein
MASRTYKNSATIATQAAWVIDPLNHIANVQPEPHDYMKKFIHFNSLFVSNEDSNTIEIYPNGSADRRQVLPQGATRNLLTSDGTVDVFDYVLVKNIGAGTVSIGNVTVRIGREGK